MTTIRHIAEIAGVSIGTVDRVLHGRGKVAQATEARVRRAIAETAYKPNVFARTLKLGRRFRFGVVMPYPEQDGGYWRLPLHGVERAGRELASQKVETIPLFFDKYGDGLPGDFFGRIADTKPDGLLVAPILTRLFIDFFSSLPDRIPYVFFDSDLPGLHPLCVITQNAHRSGRLAAELLSKIMREETEVAVVKVMPDDYHLAARVEGFLAYMASAGRRAHVHEAEIGRDPDSIHRVLSVCRTRYPRLGGLFVTNALTYRVAQAVDRMQMHPRPALVGYDLIQANAGWLQRGGIDFIISQQPEMQGYLGIRQLYRHVVLNEPPDARVSIPLDIITRENMSRNTENPDKEG
ncbi:MAG TPA: LacI family DNA-binding transcriptional regulator [bacterium]|nr:LacI family DNA-binding transcriptional regulator [bacterium]